MSGPTNNPYCDRLGLPVPRLEDFAIRRGVKPYHFMILALLESGKPLEMESIVARLLEAGVSEELANPRTLQKAWHGLSPVFKDREGKFGLELDSSEMQWPILMFELRPRPTPQPSPAPATIEMPEDDVPLSREEVDAAVRDRGLGSVSILRRVAAFLDAVGGGPIAVEELDRSLFELTGYRLKLTAKDIAYWRGELVRQDPDGALRLNKDSIALVPMRQALRKLAHPILRQRAQRAVHAAQWREHDRIHEEKKRQDAARARSLRRALLRVVPEPAHPQAAIVQDVSARTFRFFRPTEHEALLEHLHDFDVLIGLHIRETIQSLGAEPDDWHLSDIKPPQKSYKLNRQGKTLTITPELLISGTTRISSPLGDPVRTAEYLGREEWGKLARRLESDAKALYAFYRYGVLHRYVLLHWGFLHELLPADWALPGDTHVYDILKEAKTTGSLVDVVVGTAPGWENPWSRAQRVRIIDVNSRSVLVDSDAGGWELADIQDVRLSDD